jgi:hypothetical protein
MITAEAKDEDTIRADTQRLAVERNDCRGRGVPHHEPTLNCFTLKEDARRAG